MEPVCILKFLRTASAIALVAGAAATISCNDAAAPASNPLPVLLSVSPAQVVLGSAAATLTLTGTGFVRTSRARWNNADRPTIYVSAATLTVDLSTVDLAAIGSGRVTVVNPPPNGGTSGVLTVPVVNALPVIAGIAPATIVVGAAGSDVTVTGTGFVSQSSARWDATTSLGTRVASSTQMTVTIPGALLNTGGAHKITIVNPEPGGGISNAADFSVFNPAPQIIALTPDTTFTGAAFTLTVDGTGFVTSSTVRWNGTARPTTLVSASRLSAAIPATDVSTAMTASITVINPTPGGGTSLALNLRVRDAAPRITSVNPGIVTVGSAAPIVEIGGSNFSTASVARWNGQPRATQFISATALSVTLSTSDVASPTTGMLTVVNPGSSGVSNVIALAILPATPDLAVTIALQLPNNSIVYDSARDVLYASVPSSGGARANTITKIDPRSGAIIASVAVGDEPGPMAISDNGRFLYVALGGAPTVVRVDLIGFVKDIDIALGSGVFLGELYGEDLLVLPGQMRSVVVSRRNICCSPRHEGVAVYDDAVQRPRTTQPKTGSNRIVLGATGTRLYGYNNETPEFGFRRILVTSEGLQEETVKADLLDELDGDIEFDGGFVYATNGAVIDPELMTLIGTMPGFGVVRPDAAKGRVHFLAYDEICTYHYTTFDEIACSTVPELFDLTKLVRWGDDGLVAGGGEMVVFLRGNQIGP
jgi:hypothetical protein